MSDPLQDTAAAAVGTLATKATNWGAFAAVAGGFLAENWVGIGGLIIALAGFLVNWYFKWRTFKLLEQGRERDIEV